MEYNRTFLKNILGVSMLVLLICSCSRSGSSFFTRKQVITYSASDVTAVHDSLFTAETLNSIDTILPMIAPVAFEDIDTVSLIVDTVGMDSLMRNLIDDDISDEELEEIWGKDYEFSDKEQTTIGAFSSDFFANGSTVKLDLNEISAIGTYPFGGIFTSDYGFRRGRSHRGIDISARNGALDIYAFMDGVVRISKYMRGFGNVIVIRHKNGLESVYGHCKTRKVNRGDIVKSGDVIAVVGSTGRSSGAHLHFELRINGVPINPNFVVDPKLSALRKGETFIHKFDNKTILASAQSEKSKVIVKKYHKVRSGDTLSKISRNYGVSIKNLCKMNKITTTTILRIGQSLRVA